MRTGIDRNYDNEIIYYESPYKSNGGGFFMRSEKYLQFRIVQSNNAEELTDKLNRALKELQDRAPEVTFDGLIARIAYTEDAERVPEDISDEYKLKGVSLLCGDCPYFEPALKRDGSADLRSKTGRCPFAARGVTFKDCNACDVLFNKINSREVKLCIG